MQTTIKNNHVFKTNIKTIKNGSSAQTSTDKQYQSFELKRTTTQTSQNNQTYTTLNLKHQTQKRLIKQPTKLNANQN